MTDMELIRENEWLIESVSKKFYNIDPEDLYQAGALGIVKAYQNYQKNGTTKFSTYAYEYVFGEMYQVAFKNRNIKVSKDILRSYQKIEMTRSALAQKLNKVPNNQEIANFLEMDLQLVEQIILSGSTIMMSLDENPEEERSYYETVASPEQISWDEKITLQDGIQTLNESEQKIINCRYFEDMTQTETAEKLNMTQVMVSRYEKKGIEKIQQYYQMMP